LSSTAALNNALQQTAETIGSGVRGYVVETNDLKLMKWDPNTRRIEHVRRRSRGDPLSRAGRGLGSVRRVLVIVNHGNPVREAKRVSTPSEL
jgi:hypothetical protein